MRRLILMRHAKSSWADPDLRDLDRPLNKRGRRSAELLGRWLRERGRMPDVALVSSARRTQETWAGVVAAAAPAPTRSLPELYHAGPEDMLSILRRAPTEARSVLLLGHQPGIGAMAHRLLAEPPADPAFGNYPTGATAIIAFDGEDWADVGWGRGRLEDFVVPRDLA